MHRHKFKKIVVFDLDETLGYFIEFGIFWDSLEIVINRRLTQDNFNQILNLYPEFIRPDIITVLEYLKKKVLTNQCQGIMIYTNNQGPKEWVHYIKEYFHDTLHYKLFGRVISAFKVNGKRIEMCRTSHNKTMNDFIRCAKVPKYTEICYLDDTYFPDMNNTNVYYVKVKPYTHDLSFDEMIKRFINSNVGKEIMDKQELDPEFFIDSMKRNMMSYQFTYTGKDKQEYEIDKIITKKIMYHIETFFNNEKHANKSMKRKMNNKIVTRKIRVNNQQSRV